jgi:uncharacterized DUF497 family protein
MFDTPSALRSLPIVLTIRDLRIISVRQASRRERKP